MKVTHKITAPPPAFTHDNKPEWPSGNWFIHDEEGFYIYKTTGGRFMCLWSDGSGQELSPTWESTGTFTPLPEGSTITITI